ncbi:LamG domain-containing protein [Flavobacterium sp. TR2]|uniref:LamG domain-containing protein n=1 Tax=Flavobacterium sp. TR2 TaxID=2977321 RepID=UPI0021B0FB87|nr:LamG domain-containing protein [Flavobacterium sp. TR2]UWY30103.1 LamG domain-containing protein [Flavobacterium sp. TR2]
MKRIFLMFLTIISCIVGHSQRKAGYKFDKDLILYLPLNGNLTDESNLQNTCFSLGVQPEKDKNDNINGALSFEDNASISVDNVENFNELASFTLSSWVYLNEYAQHNNIISKVNPGRDFNLQITADGTVDFHTYYNGYIHFLSSYKVRLNRWTHIAFTFDGIFFKIYINGKLDRLAKMVIDPEIAHIKLPVKILWTGRNLTIGNLDANAGENFRGRLDEIRIYKKALTVNDIALLYNEKAKKQGAIYPLEYTDRSSLEPLFKSVIIDDGGIK